MECGAARRFGYVNPALNPKRRQPPHCQNQTGHFASAIWKFLSAFALARHDLDADFSSRVIEPI
jgi:hypothetical protein